MKKFQKTVNLCKTCLSCPNVKKGFIISYAICFICKYLENELLNYQVTLFDKIQFQNTKIFSIFILCSFIPVFLNTYLACLYCQIESYISLINTKSFIKLIFTSKLSDIKKEIPKGSIRNIVERRSEAIQQFLMFLLLKVPEQALYTLFFTISLFKDKKLVLILITCGTIYYTSSGFLHFLRGYLNQSYNNAIDKSSSTIGNLIENYNLYYTNDLVKLKLEEYNKNLKDELYWARIYLFAHRFIDFFEDLLIIFQRYLILNSNTSDKAISYIQWMKKYESYQSNTSFSINTTISFINNIVESKLDNLKSEEICQNSLSENYLIKIEDFGYNQLFVTINQGNKVAIVGPTGSGKSLFAKILSGEFNLSENNFEIFGNIIVNNTNIKCIPNKEIKKLSIYVQENQTIFKGLLIENLQLFDFSIFKKYIYKKCKEYNFDKDFSSYGYFTEINQNTAKSLKQKILIFRALIKNSKIIFFEDPTIFMSKKEANKIIKNILKISTKKTLFIILNNICNLKKFDQIIFLSNTPIAGTFKDLFEKSIEFKTFYLKNKFM